MSVLSDEDRKQFVTDGYFIVRDAVPLALVNAAVAEIAAARERKEHLKDGNSDANVNQPVFYATRRAPAITDLYYETKLFSIANAILDVPTCVRDDAAQIACTPPDKPRQPSGLSLHDTHPADRWHVDASHGRFAAVAADFFLLVGIALSSGQEVDENRGQLTVFPGMTEFLFSKLYIFHKNIVD